MRRYAEAREGPRTTRIRVAVVDDHTFIRELMCRALAKQNGDYHVVASVGTASEAVAVCKEFKPHLVILDIHLPDRSGVAAVPDIRRVSPATRVLLCTAFPKEDWINEATACGADGFVEKTNTWADFMVVISRVLRGERYFSASAYSPKNYMQVRDAATAANLTAREREILQLIALGMTTKEVAARLGVSVATVETHRAHLMTKTAARNVAGLVRFAIQAESGSA